MSDGELDVDNSADDDGNDGSEQGNKHLPTSLFLCCAASTPEPAAGVTWASSKSLVSRQAPSLWAGQRGRARMALHDIPRA